MVSLDAEVGHEDPISHGVAIGALTVQSRCHGAIGLRSQGNLPGERSLCAQRLGTEHGLPWSSAFQNRPSICPASLRKIFSEDGALGRPGMVMTSPQMMTTKPAPADSLTSRTGTV